MGSAPPDLSLLAAPSASVLDNLCFGCKFTIASDDTLTINNLLFGNAKKDLFVNACHRLLLSWQHDLNFSKDLLPYAKDAFCTIVAEEIIKSSCSPSQFSKWFLNALPRFTNILKRKEKTDILKLLSKSTTIKLHPCLLLKTLGMIQCDSEKIIKGCLAEWLTNRSMEDQICW